MAHAYFRVSGEFLPLEEISNLLGIQPTESQLKGDPGKYVASKAISSWCLHSDVPKSETDLFVHISALFNLLEPRAKAIREISERFDTYLVCTGRYDGTSSPGLFISKEQVALMASMGLALDCDVYFGG